MRSKKKAHLGARASPGLWAAVDLWIQREIQRTKRTVTVTDLVTRALIAFLEKAEIPIDPFEAQTDHRSRGSKNQLLFDTRAAALNDDADKLNAKPPPEPPPEPPPGGPVSYKKKLSNSHDAALDAGPLKPFVGGRKNSRRKVSKPAATDGRRIRNDPPPPRNGKGESSPPSGGGRHQE